MWKNKGGIILLIAIVIFTSSCSVTRKRGHADIGNVKGISDIGALGDAVKALNINQEGFIIKKAIVELEGTEFEGRFTLNAKVNRKGDFFVSVRGPFGIELVRAVSSGDSVFVINKINHVVMFGSRSRVLKKAGLPENLIEIIMGDIPDQISFSEAKTSDEGLVYLSYNDLKYEKDITVNRKAMKISEEAIRSSDDGTQYIMKFGNFIDSGKKRYPSAIEIEGVEKMFHVKIDILELKPGFNVKIEIVLPAYRRESL